MDFGVEAPRDLIVDFVCRVEMWEAVMLSSRSYAYHVPSARSLDLESPDEGYMRVLRSGTVGTTGVLSMVRRCTN